MTVGRVAVRDLLRASGATRELHGSVEVGAMGLTSAHLEGDGALRYELTVEARGAELVATGSVTGTWVGACRRCLEPTRGSVSVQLREIFEAAPVEGETWPIDEGFIDLVPMMSEAILLELPLAPLCRQDCAGPDPVRYPTTVSDEVGAETADVDDPGRDPRWAALEGLHLDDD